MPNVPAYAAARAKASLKPFTIRRREPGAHDVMIQILYCGVCHSDIHQVRDEWGNAAFPMVPGHEIAGKVLKVGGRVKRFKTGDAVGIGCFVDSCRKCEACKVGEEQYCSEGPSFTYNSFEQDRKTPTFGGYSALITVDEHYVLRIPKSIPLEKAAPLLCAGITMYSPLRHFGVKSGDRVGVVGLGGLGHMAVKLAKTLGAEVTVLSHSPEKRKDALRLGAHAFINMRSAGVFEKHAGQLDFILDTASGQHSYDSTLGLLRRDATMVLVGLPDPTPFSAASLIMKRRRLAGSVIGGIRETQEMLDFCAKHKLAADIELIPIQAINEAYKRVIKGDVRYRFVINMASLR